MCICKALSELYVIFIAAVLFKLVRKPYDLICVFKLFNSAI